MNLFIAKSASISNTLNKLRDKYFERVHSSSLVYNTCWEDPKCDRQLLQLSSDSKVVMITSAGDNALDYLLDGVEAIHAIDVNPRQNALLELKKVVFEHCSHEVLESLFLKGHCLNAYDIYEVLIRPHLSAFATEFWDEHIEYFFHHNPQKTFYYHGTSGKFAWMFRSFLKTKPEARFLLNQLLDAKTLEDQEFYYNQLEPKFLTKFTKWVMNRHVTMSMLGVPRTQRDLILTTYPGGMARFLADNLRHIFTELPLSDNYFWHLYIKGYYTPECSPNYLKAKYFGTLRNEVKKLFLHTTTITDFLKENPGNYTHFILLDHQDWLASFSNELLIEEWQQILNNSQSGTRILMRSAATEINFFPEFVTQAVEFTNLRSHEVHFNDRVGTYESVYLGIVK